MKILELYSKEVEYFGNLIRVPINTKLITTNSNGDVYAWIGDIDSWNVMILKGKWYFCGDEWQDEYFMVILLAKVSLDGIDVEDTLKVVE